MEITDDVRVLCAWRDLPNQETTRKSCKTSKPLHYCNKSHNSQPQVFKQNSSDCKTCGYVLFPSEGDSLADVGMKNKCANIIP